MLKSLRGLPVGFAVLAGVGGASGGVAAGVFGLTGAGGVAAAGVVLADSYSCSISSAFVITDFLFAIIVIFKCLHKNTAASGKRP